MLTSVGLHVPFTPFTELEGKTGTASPAQMESELPKLNVGVRLVVTVTVKLVGKAHRPAVGVNV